MCLFSIATLLVSNRKGSVDWPHRLSLSKIRVSLRPMFNTSQNNKMVEVLSGPERRRRRTPQEKIAIIQQTMEAGMTVSHVVRLHGINANQIFKWRRQYEEAR